MFAISFFSFSSGLFSLFQTAFRCRSFANIALFFISESFSVFRESYFAQFSSSVICFSLIISCIFNSKASDFFPISSYCLIDVTLLRVLIFTFLKLFLVCPILSISLTVNFLFLELLCLYFMILIFSEMLILGFVLFPICGNLFCLHWLLSGGVGHVVGWNVQIPFLLNLWFLLSLQGISSNLAWCPISLVPVPLL